MNVQGKLAWHFKLHQQPPVWSPQFNVSIPHILNLGHISDNKVHFRPSLYTELNHQTFNSVSPERTDDITITEWKLKTNDLEIGRGKKNNLPALSSVVIEALKFSSASDSSLIWNALYLFCTKIKRLHTSISIFYCPLNVNLMIPISYLTSVCSVMEGSQ